MATRRFDINKEQSIGQWSGGGAGNNRGSGKDTHAPVGRHTSSDIVWRILERYAHDFSGMYQITSAILHRKSTGQVHTGFGGSPRHLVSRVTTAFSMGGGGENNWTSGSAEDWPGPSQSTTGQADSGLLDDDENSWVTTDVTDLMGVFAPSTTKRADGSAGGGATNYGVRVMSFDESTSSRTLEFYGLRSAYPPYIIVTYVANAPPQKPVGTSPSGSTTGTITFDATGGDPDVGDTFASYDMKVTDVTGGGVVVVYAGTNLTAGRVGWDLVAAPYAGPALTNGHDYEWTVAFRDNHGAQGPFSDPVPFTMVALPTVGTQTPGANGLAPIWNLSELGVWTAGGSHAKPRLAFVYNSAAGISMGRYRVYIDDSAGTNLYDSGWLAGTAAPGATFTADVNYAIVNGTQYRWRVQVEDAEGNQSAITAFLNFKVRWGQAVYSYNAGGSSSSWNAAAGALTGSTSQMAAIFQSAGDAAGTVTPSAWFAQVGQVPVQAYVRVLIRLATATSGTNASLADYTFQSTSASQQPDNWSCVNGSIVLDPAIRRYGNVAARVTLTSGTAATLYPWRKAAGDAVSVTPDTEYAFSAWVRTDANLSPGKIELRVFNKTLDALYGPPVAPAGYAISTTDTRSKDEGWQRLVGTLVIPSGVTVVTPTIQLNGATVGQRFWVDGVLFEPSPVASPWAPSLLGEGAVIDAYGINIDRSKGGTLRLRGATGGVRDVVELGPQGLLFGSDTELKSSATGQLEINGVPITAGTGAPTGADYLVGTAQAGLSAEIVVGTAPGGELGGTWASPTVDATHSGSSHAGVVSAHEALSDPHPGYALDSDLTTHAGAADPHTGYRLESADHTHASTGLQGGLIAHSVLTGLTTGDPHTQYQQESEKGVANGYASLDSGILVPIAQIPTGTTGTTVALGNHAHAHSALTGITATDHHAAPAAGPDANITVDAAGAAGTASTFARSAHGHQLVTSSATPAATAASGAAGTSGTAPSRGDHAHAHGSFTTGDLHTLYALDTDLSSHSAAADPHTVYPLATSGSWTPGFTFATAGNLVATASIAIARWRRVGNVVHWWVRMSFSTFTHTTASGLARITGNNAATPMTLTNWNWIGAAMLRFTLTNYTWAQSYVAQADGNIYVRLGGSGVNGVFLDATHLLTGQNPDIFLSGSYEV